MAVALLLCLAPSLELRAAGSVALAAGRWVLGTIVSHVAGKAIDYATGQTFRQQLEDEIPWLVKRISEATGAEREALEEKLGLVREELALVSRVVDRQEVNLAEIRGEQERLLQRIDDLEARMANLEGQVYDLRARVDQLEEALISECLDLRFARTLGAEGFRIGTAASSLLVDDFADRSLSLSTRLYLNSCSGDLTQRGLLIQLSMVTRGLNRDMSAFVTFKRLSTDRFSAADPSNRSRLEFPMSRPGYSSDGQVREIFIPYAEIPFLSATERVALAMVVTHDGGPMYVLSDQVISCVFGQRINCRWGH